MTYIKCVLSLKMEDEDEVDQMGTGMPGNLPGYEQDVRGDFMPDEVPGHLKNGVSRAVVHEGPGFDPSREGNAQDVAAEGPIIWLAGLHAQDGTLVQCMT